MFVHHRDLEDFPAKDMPRVADFGSAGGQAFEGVRVLFPDGAHNHTLEVRACYSDKPFCFMQSVGAIVDKEGDSDLMLFLTAYLRSKLARYLLFYTSFSLTMERPHVKLREIEKLPFLAPERHKNPSRARGIVKHVAEVLKPFQQLRSVEGNEDWTRARAELDELVFDYFELSATERTVVSDTCDFIIPSRLPRSLQRLRLQLFRPPAATEYGTYARLLRDELETWRVRLQGEGQFEVELSRPKAAQPGTMGVVRIGLSAGRPKRAGTPAAVEHVLQQLRGDDAFPQVGGEGLTVASDLLLFHGGRLLLRQAAGAPPLAGYRGGPGCLAHRPDRAPRRPHPVNEGTGALPPGSLRQPLASRLRPPKHRRTGDGLCDFPLAGAAGQPAGGHALRQRRAQDHPVLRPLAAQERNAQRHHGPLFSRSGAGRRGRGQEGAGGARPLGHQLLQRPHRPAAGLRARVQEDEAQAGRQPVPLWPTARTASCASSRPSTRATRTSASWWAWSRSPSM
jgi:hypothetical protein